MLYLKREYILIVIVTVLICCLIPVSLHVLSNDFEEDFAEAFRANLSYQQFAAPLLLNTKCIAKSYCYYLFVHLINELWGSRPV